MIRRRVIDVSALPHVAFGSNNLVWWGTLLMCLIEGTVFALTVGSYFYLRTRVTQWPPGMVPPDLRWGTLNVALLVAAIVPNELARRAALKEELQASRVWLAAAALFGLAFTAVRALEFTTLNVHWDTNAYGSAVWTLLGFHSAHIVTDTLDTIVLLWLLMTGPIQEKRFVDVAENSDYYYFVVGAWIPIYAVIYLVPRWL